MLRSTTSIVSLVVSLCAGFVAACATAPPISDTTGAGTEAPDGASDRRGAVEDSPAGRTPSAGPSLPDAEPMIRVGVLVGIDSTTVMSTGRLRLLHGTTGEVLDAGNDEILRFHASGGNVQARRGDGRRTGLDPAAAYVVQPLDDGSILIGGRPYRGAARLIASPRGDLVVINTVALEDYLLGVVPAEIGSRSPEELESVKVQAVAARTYAIAHLGRRDSLGFDVFGTVEDQVYGGADVEREEVTRAVRETAGQIITFDGLPIQAFYHSTCGGHTATRFEVWGDPDLPYLRSVSDRDGGGDFCEISPRYRWTQSWSAEELNGVVPDQLAAYLGRPVSEIGRIVGIRVLSRTEHDRVDELEIEASGGRFIVRKNDTRFVLRSPDGRILGSSDFRVRQGRVGSEPVIVEGRGFGHGIGLCQWGAIARARAGQGYREIISAYYAGVEIERVY